MNGEKGYHFFASLIWRNWTVMAAFAGDDQIQPVSWGPAIFNNRGTQNKETRNFIDAAYERQVAGGTLRWRTYYDAFYYVGRFEYALSDGGVEDNRQHDYGDWAGTQLTYRLRPSFAGDITVGLEAKVDLRAVQIDADVTPVPSQYVNTNNPDRNLALFFEDEKKLSERWTLDVGVRVDKSAYRRDFIAPRGALIYQRSDWTYKFLYGRSFRNPSAFQLFYGDGIGQLANPNARPEWADTAEVDVERKLGKRMNLVASAYGYKLHDYILAVYLPDGLAQYQNTPKIQAEGVELEIIGRPTDWLEVTASYAVQRARDYQADGILEDSPSYLAKLRFAVPLGRKFDFSSGTQYESRRSDLGTNWVRPVYLADFTLVSKHLTRDFDIRLGLRNAFNLKYSDPVALTPSVSSMPQTGRTYFVELIAHKPDRR